MTATDSYEYCTPCIAGGGGGGGEEGGVGPLLCVVFILCWRRGRGSYLEVERGRGCHCDCLLCYFSKWK